MLIDTHCHLNDLEHFPDPETTIREAQQSGVGKLIVIGVDLASSRRAVEIAEANEGVFAVAGFHPNYTASYESKNLDELAPLLHHPKVVGIGEIGLDFFREHSPPERQYAALNDQLELAKELRKPVIFHCRKAYSELLTLLEHRNQTNPYLFHCFAGDSDELRRALAFDSYFGVDGPVTYNSAHDLRDVLRQIPTDRLLLETDSPYLPPVPYRGKRNHPAYLRFINDALASTIGLSPKALEDQTSDNAKNLFGI